MKHQFWTLDAEINTFLALPDDEQTLTRCLHLLRACQVSARNEWIFGANAMFALEECRGKLDSATVIRQDGFDSDPNNKD